MERYLYLIKFNNLYKIGISVNPSNRLQQLSLGENAEIVHKKLYPHAKLIESAIHDIYSRKQVSGEWFELSDDDVELIKDFDMGDYTSIC